MVEISLSPSNLASYAPIETSKHKQAFQLGAPWCSNDGVEERTAQLNQY